MKTLIDKIKEYFIKPFFGRSVDVCYFLDAGIERRKDKGKCPGCGGYDTECPYYTSKKYVEDMLKNIYKSKSTANRNP